MSYMGNGQQNRAKFEEGLASVLQLFLEPRGAVAISAGPGLGAILIAAIATVVPILPESL